MSEDALEEVDYIGQIAMLKKRVVELEAALKYADEHAVKIEALLEPHVDWKELL